MNRTEAYEILVSRLREHSASAIELKDAPAKEVHRGDSGTLYEVDFRIEDDFLKASIHDHNTQKFELLEEAIELKESRRNLDGHE